MVDLLDLFLGLFRGYNALVSKWTEEGCENF